MSRREARIARERFRIPTVEEDLQETIEALNCYPLFRHITSGAWRATAKSTKPKLPKSSEEWLRVLRDMRKSNVTID